MAKKWIDSFPQDLKFEFLLINIYLLSIKFLDFWNACFKLISSHRFLYFCNISFKNCFSHSFLNDFWPGTYSRPGHHPGHTLLAINLYTRLTIVRSLCKLLMLFKTWVTQVEYRTGIPSSPAVIYKFGRIQKPDGWSLYNKVVRRESPAEPGKHYHLHLR